MNNWHHTLVTPKYEVENIEVYVLLIVFLFCFQYFLINQVEQQRSNGTDFLSFGSLSIILVHTVQDHALCQSDVTVWYVKTCLY